MGKGWLGGSARNWELGSWSTLKIHMHTQMDKKKTNKLKIVSKMIKLRLRKVKCAPSSSRSYFEPNSC